MAESQKQRLERIAVQILAGRVAQRACDSYRVTVEQAILHAKELMKQVDELPPIE